MRAQSRLRSGAFTLMALLWAGCAAAAPFHLGPPISLPLPGNLTLPQEPEPRQEITPNEAAQRAQQMAGGGKILAVDAVPRGYRVKLLKNGEVKIVFVPN